jgi:hypothetical protein
VDERIHLYYNGIFRFLLQVLAIEWERSAFAISNILSTCTCAPDSRRLYDEPRWSSALRVTCRNLQCMLSRLKLRQWPILFRSWSRLILVCQYYIDIENLSCTSRSERQLNASLYVLAQLAVFFHIPFPMVRKSMHVSIKQAPKRR